MSDILTVEQDAIIRTVDKIAERYDRRYWLDHAHTGTFPRSMWKALADAGILGIAVPEPFGGTGLGLLEMALVQERLAEHGVPLLLFVVGPGLSLMPIVRHGTADQMHKFVKPAVTGDKVFCFGITEPGAGSNTMKIETFGRRTAHGYRVTGQKVFISGAEHADYMLLVARTAEYNSQGRDGLSLMVIDLKAPGVRVVPQEMLVQSLERQAQVFLEDVEVPESAVIGEAGQGFRYLFDALNPERINVAAMAVGLGRYLTTRAVDYAKTREVFGVSIGSHQSLQHPLAEAKTHLELAWLMNLRAAEVYDQGGAPGEYANMAKLGAVDAALEAADIAIEVHGGNGFTRDYDLLSIWTLCRLLKTAPVSRELVLSYIGHHVLGLPASY
ncbi:MAG: acyl-CoA dehydrogenase [Sulfobacillus benefaciens]|uniref:Acyl-CoA dehydrogenase n=1 Tax=Sulfobacillus benefaciens TaxID=453960 RepID=A0A2T2XJR8_9FIRM|nr:MAG: acyl-CoA dehydrogenase [Sulfobacillus benefaciens]